MQNRNERTEQLSEHRNQRGATRKNQLAADECGESCLPNALHRVDRDRHIILAVAT